MIQGMQKDKKEHNLTAQDYCNGLHRILKYYASNCKNIITKNVSKFYM
jgi:hypothetical protein